MAAPVVCELLPALQPAAPAAEPQVGNLQEREVSILRSACRDKDEETGAVISRLLTAAALVTGVFAAIVIPGITGTVLGVATYLILGELLGKTYHGLRNHDYLAAGQALHTRSFKEYIFKCKVKPLTIDNIVPIHKEYKKLATAMAQQLQARPVV